MTVYSWTKLISSIILLLTSFYICWKAMNYKASAIHITHSVVWCFLWALVYSFEPSWMPLLMIRTLFCALSIIFIWTLLKIKLDTIVSAYLLSYGISNILYYIAVVPLSLISAPFLSVGHIEGYPIDFDRPIYLLFYMLVATLQILLAYLFLKIRRFKQGFPFLHGRYAVVVALIVAGIVLALVSAMVSARNGYENGYLVLSFVAGVIIIGSGVFIWIRRSIKSYYKHWLKTHNEELHHEESEAKDKEIQYYKGFYETIRAANHSMKHRQSTMERVVISILEKAKKYELPTEFSEELSVALENIQKLVQEYHEKVDQVNVVKVLPSTNIQMVDGLFAHFSEQFINDKIDFKLKVNGSIIHMIDSVIEQSKLETMIGDHLQDALIAINSIENNTARNVLVIIGEVGDYYEFSVHDSGIPFEIDILVQLGTEKITTHADEGGGGIGFMTTFETMRECEASLVIKENPPGGAFSKSVSIRFDGKNQYVIESYRADKFPKSERYTVVGI